MNCSLPWQSMGIKTNHGVFCCCLAAGGSLCQPSDFPYDEFENRDIWTEGILSKLWNSNRFKSIREAMIDEKSTDACGMNGNRCFSNVAGECCTYPPQTELQISNVRNMINSFRNNEIEVNHYPVNIDCCLGQICNMRCPHCCQKYETPKIDLLPLEKFQDEMVEFLQHAIRLAIFGGEPTVCPQYDMLLALVKRANGAKVSLVTNGQFLIQKFLPYKDLFWEIQISVDATKSETYEKIRQSSDTSYNFDRLMHNINRVSRYKKNSDFEMDFFFVINGYNYTEMKEMLRLAQDSGARFAIFNEIFDYDYEDVDESHVFGLKSIYYQCNKEYYLERINDMLEEATKIQMSVIYCFPSFNLRGKL